MTPSLAVKPWRDLPPDDCRKLWDAGLVTEQQVAETSIRALVRIAGVSNRQARKIRAVIPRQVPEVTAVTRRARNGGRLWSGNPKQRGKMREEVRDACREAFSGRIALLEELADDELVSIPWRLRALEMLARYGLGTRPEKDREGIALEDVTALVQALAEATEPFVDESDLPRIGTAWTAIVRDRFPAFRDRSGEQPG